MLASSIVGANVVLINVFEVRLYYYIPFEAKQ
jgi:hypothetical protein